MQRAIHAWEAGDLNIARQDEAGRLLQLEIASQAPRSERIKSLLAEISGINDNLTVIENHFVGAMGDASRLTYRLLQGIMLAATPGLLMLEPSSLELEITESLVMSHGESAVAVLQKLKSIGVRIAIDDFGTGYSSLAYLKRFPIDTLKVDRSFVRDIPSDSGDKQITRAIIALAHSLRLRVVAEGVETVDQLKFLRSQRCDTVQGYYLYRPLPEAEVAPVLKLNRMRRDSLVPVYA